ncbi:hypothetical protein KSP39_PZI002311 [Platanthera zijinensis]|uniref:Uncharacterized protein n=1 Tax=Platanthera zijinensis TaxID=2320716 RepID=A0AAP0BYG5_9ASPA
MSALWEKSSTWRWLVRKTRDSKRFFFVFATMCGVVPAVIGYGVMQITNSRNEQLEAQLRKTARPESLGMFAVNPERVNILLGDIEGKLFRALRYVGGFKGSSARLPSVRILGGLTVSKSPKILSREL